ncbi:MAG: class I SAM-dependent methyltransferase [Chthoniobacterales bacterium]|nr:class I SAM-dependent methyltransferase [Chthoniobacterales bacterium]
MTPPHDESDLSRIYTQRFTPNQEYRREVWRTLTSEFFQRLLPLSATVLDLGCGYGEFINHIHAARKLAMDLNPDALRHLANNVEFVHQDCAQPWPISAGSLDAVFTSNFFEHLPDKAALGRTLDHIRVALKPGGRLIAMGPNIKHVPGSYWDFWDHYIPLTEQSLAEALCNRGFEIECARDRFMPYTMTNQWRAPISLIRIYLQLPAVWKFFGRQFLVIGSKP